MKAYRYAIMAATVALINSCSEDKEMLSGDGILQLNPTVNTDVKFSGSRASDQEALRSELGESLKLWISNKNGVIRAYEGIDNVPTELTLLSGQYVAEAWAGDSVSASWDKRWFKAEPVKFEISKGSVTSVDIPCKIANVVVSVEYAADVDDVLQDYSITVGHSRGSLTFEGENTRGFFMMPDADTDLSWTLTGTKKVDGNTLFTRFNSIPNVQPGHEYIFRISCSSKEQTEIGGGFLKIEIDDTVIEASDNITIPAAPSIQGYRFNIDEPLYAEPGQVGHRSVYVSACGQLTSLVLKSDVFTPIIGGPDFDYFSASDAIKTKIESMNLGLDYLYDSELESSTFKFTFTEEFCSAYLSTEGDYSFEFSATDDSGKTSAKTWIIKISEIPIVIEQVEENAISLTEATVTGSIISQDKLADNAIVTIYYAPASMSRADEWKSVEAVLQDNKFSVTLTNLKAGTQYQYYASVPLSDGNIYATESIYFNTKPHLQLPNAGFEEWQTSSTPYLIYPAGGTMFWDSGNHGSATMKKNVTVPDSDVKKSGTYSIKLASQFVGIGSIGKFAAGNVFAGEYLATDGTDGILGFGRPFADRPLKLHGYVKYKPVAIDNVASDAPAEYVKGEMDRGIIYMALMDDYTEDYEGNSYPVIVKTKSKQLFNKDSEHVIAYGEKIFTEANDNMVEFEIEFVYRSDKMPSYIVLTAAASKGGDYFTGGNGSTMWLDDLELIYE